MADTIVTANGVPICTESFGDPAHPPILLMMGAMASMLWWDEEFCRMLAGRGRYVIRYDSRDTGRSITGEPGHIDYTVNTLVDDALGLLDVYGIARAHLVGMSLGGMLAQIIALKCPERVYTITAIASGPFVSERPELPPIDPKVLAYHASAGELDWSDHAAVIEYMVGGWRLLTGSRRRFDEDAARRLAAGETARANNLLSSMNHAMLGGGEEWYDRLGEIHVPTLVIHGTDDPVLPYPHALVLSREVAGAELLRLEGAGHELNRDDWEVIIDAIVRHTS